MKISKQNLKLKIFFLVILFGGIFGLAENSWAVDHYVRAGSGNISNCGDSWINACEDLNNFTKVINGKTEKLTRGDTYYIASGTYESYTFDDDESGTQYIYIKKAIATDDGHGTDDGWLNIYGDGTAEFFLAEDFVTQEKMIFEITTSYLDIDGQNYGIKLNVTERPSLKSRGIRINGNATPGINHINLKNIEIAGPAGSARYNWSSSCLGIYGPGDSTNITISGCKIHGLSVLIKLKTTDNLLVEHNLLYDSNSSNPTYHPDVMYISGGSDNGIFRYNKVYNYSPEGVYWAGPYEEAMSNWYIYGNVFYNDLDYVPKNYNARGIEIDLQKYETGSVSNLKIYNNTFVNLNNTFLASDADIASGGEFINNIRYNSGSIPTDANLTVQSDLVNPSNLIFNNFTNFDFRLAVATERGVDLGFPYDKDMLGNTRTNWNIGAYEYAGNIPPDLIPPSNPNGLSVR